MVSRATSLNGLLVLRDFKVGQIAKRRSEDLRKEFGQLMSLRWQTIIKYGSKGEVVNARRRLAELKGTTSGKGTNRRVDRRSVAGKLRGGGCERQANRSWAMPLVGATDYM
jgi:hypothetical protein